MTKRHVLNIANSYFNHFSSSLTFLLCLSQIVLSHSTVKDPSQHVFKSRSYSSTTMTGSDTNMQNSDPAEENRYATLPPTVFAPSGRLHMVEKTARDASDSSDESAPLVLCLKCGAGVDEYIIVLASPLRSPHLYHGEIRDKAQIKDGMNIENHVENENQSFPLLLEETAIQNRGSSLRTLAPPLAILFHDLVVGTGGNAVDSSILLRRIQEASLSLHKSNDGGSAMRAAFPNSSKSFVGSDSLARRIADLIQEPTQTVGGRSGRVLASSAVIIGSANKEKKTIHKSSMGKEATMPDNSSAKSVILETESNYVIWRIDPSGQFWNCNAVAIGRGAGLAEAALLRQVSSFRKDSGQCLEGGDSNGINNQRMNLSLHIDQNKNQDDVDLENIMTALTNRDVQVFLESLLCNDALLLACRCLVSAITKRTSSQNEAMFNKNFLGVQGLLIRQDRSGKSLTEVIESDAIQKALRIAMKNSVSKANS